MKRKLLIITSFTAAAGLLAAGVQASDDNHHRGGNNLPPQEEWMSLSELSASLISQGYTIREVETEDGVYSIEMTDENGLEVERDYDVVTGEPVRRPYHDD